MDLTNRLSKSRYTKGLRCPRALYLSVHHYELGSQPTPVQQARFDVGHRVGALAQARYPGGVLIAEDHLHHAQAVETTRRALDAGTPALFEAAFTHDNVKVRVDVLRRLDSGGFELIEVKSTGGYSEKKHLPDAAVQLYVLLGAGVDVRRVTLMHLDKGYIYPGGDYDPHALLAATDITHEAFRYIADVPGHVARMMEVLALPELPAAPADVSCTKPYECEFHAWCTRDEEPPDFGAPLKTDEAVLRRLDCLRFPLHFVDFETVNPGLPLFPGTSPFQAVKVQWSVDTLHRDGRLDHSEWLIDDASTDPSHDFATTLLRALGDEGTFVHYSHYEVTQLVDIALHHPDLRQPIVDRIPRLWDNLTRKLSEAGMSDARLVHPEHDGLALFDLGMRIVRDGCVHPALGENGWSIKPAVKVLAPHLPAYAGLAVSDGDQAMLATTEMLDPATTPERAAAIRRDLLEYCEQDTRAMVEIYRTLVNLKEDRVTFRA